MADSSGLLTRIERMRGIRVHSTMEWTGRRKMKDEGERERERRRSEVEEEV